MLLDKTAAISPDFKWLGFRSSDLIPNQNRLQTNLFLIILNPVYKIKKKLQSSAIWNIQNRCWQPLTTDS